MKQDCKTLVIKPEAPKTRLSWFDENCCIYESFDL